MECLHWSAKHVSVKTVSQYVLRLQEAGEMPQTFIVDQAATFQAVAFLGSSPRMQFGTQMQDKTKDGLPKWDVEVIASFRDSFGKTSHETLKVGVASPKDPGEGLGMYTPIQLVNFTVGVMDKTVTDKVTGEQKVVGAQVWYRADGVRPTTAPSAKG